MTTLALSRVLISNKSYFENIFLEKKKILSRFSDPKG